MRLPHKPNTEHQVSRRDEGDGELFELWICPYTENAKYMTLYFQNKKPFHIVGRHLYQGALYICMMDD